MTRQPIQPRAGDFSRGLETTRDVRSSDPLAFRVFDNARTTYGEMLRIFWESHDPTQGMRQGNDAGTQYRSAIFVASDDQLSAAKLSRDRFQAALISAGHGEITTEIAEAGPFYYAEDYHQQYLAKNPTGYCGLGGTGVACPVGLTTAEG